MNALKLLVLTIATSILVSGVMNQAPTPTASAAMDTALDALVTGKCWRKSDITGLTFSASATSRRAQAPTPPSTCSADWTTVAQKWTANNVLVGTFNTQFATAMTTMNTCLSSHRRLQAPTPTPSASCVQADTELSTAFGTLGQTLMGVAKAAALVTAGNAVTITHTAVTLTGDDGGVMAAAAWAAYGTLRTNCASGKLMSLPTSRRAQAPTPAPVVDAACNTNLATVLAFRATRIAQATALLIQATTADCVTPTRRLRRIMRLKNEQRSLQAPTPHYCDTAEKATKLALACLAINGDTWSSSSSGSGTATNGSTTPAATGDSTTPAATTDSTTPAATTDSTTPAATGDSTTPAATDTNGAAKIDTGDSPKVPEKETCKKYSYVMKIAAVGVMSLAAMFF